MLRKINFTIAITLFFLLLWKPLFPLAAEEELNVLTMEELSIKVMPEFTYHPNDDKKDHPPLLIGYQGTMRNQSEQQQKGQIEIPLPMGDKNFRIGYAADYSSDLSKVYEIEYIMDPNKGTISWTTSEEIKPNDVYKFVFEFFTDTISVEKEKKTLSYQFKSFTDIGLFNVSFIEPLKAEKVVLEPPTEKKNSHGDEKGIHSYFIQGLKAGEEKSYHLTYERDETATTIDMKDTPKQRPIDNKSSNPILSITAVSGVGVLAAGSLAFFYKRNRRKN